MHPFNSAKYKTDLEACTARGLSPYNLHFYKGKRRKERQNILIKAIF
jgi:hypothetical protein